MRNALIVWGGWPGHEPKECVDLFTPWLVENGFNVEVSDNLDAYLDTERMKWTRPHRPIMDPRNHH